MDHAAGIPVSGEQSATERVSRAASSVFWVMFAINLFNYLDRYVLPAALSKIQNEFGLSDTKAGALSTAFLLVYAVAALPLSIWADRGVRKNVISICVAIWSVATCLSGFSTGFWTLFGSRALVGIGEAGYYPAGTSLLSDYYPRAARARVMSKWGAGSLIGLAIGFSLGGIIAGSIGWRAAFFITGLPGLLVALLAWRMREPVRGAADGWRRAGAQSGQPFGAQVRLILGTRTIVVGILLQIFAFWVLGAAAYWLPIYLQRAYGFKEGKAGTVSGAVLVVAGIAGVLLGGALADKLTERWASGRVLACGITLALGAPCFALAVTRSGFGTFLPLFFASALFLSMYSGPLTAVTQDVVPPAVRALVVSLTLLIGHLFGDVTSPLIVGAISDHLGGGAHGLSRALLVTCPLMLLCAGVVGLIGSRYVAHDLARMDTERLAHVG
jgi:MFS transporter, Spinster family, sphingosine-1-phosphate transporter